MSGQPARTSGAGAGNGGATEAAPVDAPPTEPLSYEAASARVEEIIRRLDSGEATLNETVALVGEGKRLIELCARELESVSGTLQELRLDELVERLEGGRPGTGDARPTGHAPREDGDAGGRAHG